MRSIFTFTIAALILTACSQTSITSTPLPESTPTSSPTATPIPTPTLHPQFVELQSQIAASGERFTLNPDGTVQDGATAIAGLNVAPDGKITITVGGELVTLDPAKVKFDDTNGVTIEGYTQDENGDWGVEVVIPEFLTEFEQTGGLVDMNKGVAWNPEDGRVAWLRVGEEFVDTSACLPLTQEDGSVVCEIPIFVDGKFGFEYANDKGDLVWNNTNWNRKPSNSVLTEINKMNRKIWRSTSVVWYGNDKNKVFKLETNDGNYAYIAVCVFKYGDVDVSLLTWRSIDGWHEGLVFVLGNAENLEFDVDNYLITDGGY